jgi:glycerophosphoryl diester phosphodiesterase
MTAPSWLRDTPLAHRGLHGPGRPENSLAAFRAAAEAGVGVELDVRRTADGVTVVFHDHDLTRLAGRDATVESTAFDRLARLRLDESDEPIPTLNQALDVLREVPVMVEIKSVQRQAGLLEPAVAAIVAAHPGPVCIAGFNPASIRWFTRHAPDVVRVQTAGPLRDVAMPRVVRWSLRTLRFLALTRPDAVSYDLAGVDHPVVQAFRAGGGTVITWTVRTEADLARARDLADNVIFEDLPVGAVTRGG